MWCHFEVTDYRHARGSRHAALVSLRVTAARGAVCEPRDTSLEISTVSSLKGCVMNMCYVYTQLCVRVKKTRSFICGGGGGVCVCVCVAIVHV